MRKIPFLLFLILLLSFLCGCSVDALIKGPIAELVGSILMDPAPVTPPPPDEGYRDPTHKSGTYKIEFVMGNRTVVHYYEALELPEPPTDTDYENNLFSWIFLGWDREITAVTKDARYTAQYDKMIKQYTATFLVGRREIKVKTNCGAVPTPPATANFEGMRFVCWDRPLTESVTDVTYTAVYTDTLSVESMQQVYNEPLSAYSTDFQTMHMAASYVALAVQEHAHPLDGAIAARLAAFVETFFAKEQGAEILFDARANWGFAGLAATFATVKDTPTVYNRLDASTREKMDTFMWAIAYTVAFNMADYNNYKSGPGMAGNFGKEWNPNYRLGNIPCMPFVVHYFGYGDMEAGALLVERAIGSFDNAEYARMIGRFSVYGWTKAYRCWTSPAPVDGALDAQTLLVDGGNATVHPDYKQGGGGGGGKGVSGQGQTFAYKGYSLLETEGMLDNVIEYTFSGGKVTSDYYFDVTGDGQPDRIGYILDGTRSPLEGKDGLMLEFASGNRSSSEYNNKNFTILIPVLYAAYHLPRYTSEGGVRRVLVDLTDGTEVSLYDVSERGTLWERVQIGTEDFLYKLAHGYHCFASGMYYEGAGSDDYEHLASRGYFAAKDMWRSTLLPLGRIDPTT